MLDSDLHSLRPEFASRAIRELRVLGARTHNLQNISITIPHKQLTVITGVSGSGKSSLAFDTIFAEGQRQYIESLSTYARQFLHQLVRPDVDSIEGLQPTLCIDQKASTANPRSTVATVTEIYDYLRLLMARVGTPHCYVCGEAIIQQSPEQIVKAVCALPQGTKVVLLAPVVRGRRGAHADAISAIQKAGLVRLRVDGQIYDIESLPELAVRKNHTIEAIVDKLVVRPDNENRIADSISTSIQLASGLVAISYLNTDNQSSAIDHEWQERLFSTLYSCASCGSSFEELEPRTFSFNSPYGACPDCSGTGRRQAINPESLVADWDLSGKNRAFSFLAEAPKSLANRLRKQTLTLLAEYNATWATPLSKISTRLRQSLLGSPTSQPASGLCGILSQFVESEDPIVRQWLETFLSPQKCSTCNGSRLRREALSVLLSDKSMAAICEMTITAALDWFENLVVPLHQQPVAQPILTEMLHRFRFLKRVGVGYLSLNRPADTLSGGELQRVRLATCIGTGLVGVCYILDEPSIGLHQRDNDRLIESLRNLQRQGNTVVVVEHDEAMMRAADMLVDMGPGAGKFGGQIVAQGTPEQVQRSANSLTADYLIGLRKVNEDRPRRVADKNHQIRLTGASLHNLKNVEVAIPLGLLIGFTGVSGSGKSSLVGQTLVPAILRELKLSPTARPGPFALLEGTQHIDKLVELSQTPIGRTPRSTPATYCGVFDLIRAVWAGTREAKSRGFSAGRFSFNAGNGRCSTCMGQGQEKIEMNFLPDLYVTCSSCNGSRYNRQTLQVRYREKTVADVLNFTVDEAAEFFENFEKIQRLLRTLQQVGLGYLSLGQNSNTLSGGESQRIKLATELARPETGRTIYFLDEPTTGLHFEDVKRLIAVLNGLVDRGNTVIVIEHNLDVIRGCDWLVDLGPEGGEMGGQIVTVGTPEEVARNPSSLTGRYL